MWINTMPRQNNQPGKGHKVISKQSNVHHPAERKILPKRKTSQAAASLPRSGRPTRFSLSSECEGQRNDHKPKSSISDSTGLSLQVKGHGRAVRQTPNQSGYLEGLKEKASSL
ncbi:hypothetical protein ATANTOWER_029807 [Ataeniobius toweri]|uniref:Uncharacterized protein n=1 Tax=Ataeniobius toweri TaxID=208326 RepID=A0ABU7C402_9TELE|nr:hypothetical protein [Ataeniobius toweri]